MSLMNLRFLVTCCFPLVGLLRFTAPLHAQNPPPQVAVAPFSVESDSAGAVRAVAEACLDGLVSELKAKGIKVVQHAQLSETKLAAARPAIVVVLGKFRREGAQYPGELRLMEAQSGEELRAYFTNDKDPAAAAKSGQAAAGRIASVLKELKAQPPGRRTAGQDSLTGPMVRMITGDPEKPGRFVVRITFPRGSHTEPHYHTADVTGRVLRGRLLMGSTPRFDTTRVVPFEQRGSKVVKAREVHFDWWPEGGELEIEGKGPMETVMVDSTGKPLPR